jgi:hypothetical protein
VGPLAARRIANLKANRRGHVALKLFLVLFLLTLPAEFLANDKPLFVWHDGAAFVPALVAYPETAFGGDFPSEADYRDPAVQELIAAKGWAVWPPIPYSYDTVITDLGLPAPSPPSARNPLGTDDQSRDVLARVVYGFRLSVLFGLILTLLSSALGIAAGAVQGYFGGWVDLGFQRFMEVWGGPAADLPPDHPGQRDHPRLLDPARPDAAVRLDEPRRRGPRRVPARPQPRLRPRGPALWASPTGPSCSATSCPTRWSRPSPSCRSS